MQTDIQVKGTIARYKERLVAKGHTQEHCFDFNETFSPVIKPTIIGIILTIALYKDWSMRQLDVNNAFLNGELKEQVYVEQPPGFQQDKNYVCKLNKTIYGHKQAPKCGLIN